MKLYARLAAAAAFCLSWPRPRRPPTNCRTCWARASCAWALMDAAPWGFKDAKGEAAGLTSIWPG